MPKPISTVDGRIFLGIALGTLFLLASPATAGNGRLVLIQTNSAGDNVHLIDVATNKVVGEITNEEVNHGVVVSPDASRLYISNEADATLDVIDTKTLGLTKKIPLTGRPNNLAIHKDGRRIYLAIVGEHGGVDIVDTAAEKKIKFIPTIGGEHNTFISPDSKYVVASSTRGKNITVIDTATDEPVWTLYFEAASRPLTFDTNPDGSTKRLFVQLTELHGFAIVDFEKRREVGRVELPDKPTIANYGSPTHGIVVSPDQKTLWVLSDVNSHLYAYSLPDLKPVGDLTTGRHPHWLTFTPDGTMIYVANSGENTVSAIHAASRKEVARIKVGQIPKRNLAVVLPFTDWD